MEVHLNMNIKSHLIYILTRFAFLVLLYLLWAHFNSPLKVEKWLHTEAVDNRNNGMDLEEVIIPALSLLGVDGIWG